MAKISELKQAILDFLRQELAPSGFRPSHQTFYRKTAVGKEILHIALIKGRSEIEIKANIDIRHNELERLYNTLLGESPNTPTATIGAEFGKLLGSESSMVWIVKDISDVPIVGNSILKILWSDGLPFLEKYASLEKIFEVLDAEDPPRQSFCPIPHVRVEKALIAAYLLGKHKEYDNLINSKLVYLTSIGSPHVNHFINFANQLKEKIKVL